MNTLEEWVLKNKNQIERGVETVGLGCEVLAVTVGKLHPILEAVFVSAAELLRNPEGKETRYVTEQFQKLDQKLASVRDETAGLTREMQLSSMNKQIFDVEAQIISQYEKFQEFVNAKPEFKEKKKEKFLCHFESTGGDLNIDTLYNAVASTSKEPMLDTVLETKQRSRRAVEEFCSGLKKLFVMAIIGVMGHASLCMEAEGPDLLRKWLERIEDVENRMKAAVDDCTENFAKQAKADMEHQLLEKTGGVDSEFIQPLLDFLAKKYDWVSWSVRVAVHRGMFLWNCLAGAEYEGSCGSRGNFFDILTKHNTRVFISFSVTPRPINKSQILELIEGQSLRGKMADVARLLSNSLPDCAVYAVSSYKEMAESNTFQDECYFYKRHRRAYLCIHSI